MSELLEDQKLYLLSLGTTIAVHETAAYELATAPFEAEELEALASLPIERQFAVRGRLVEILDILREAADSLETALASRPVTLA